MPKYRFEAMDPTGQEISDEIVAEDEAAALLSINQMGLFVTSSKPPAIRKLRRTNWPEPAAADATSAAQASRRASVERKTNETNISLELNLDGSGTNQIHTGVGFFDHMLDLFGRHGVFDLKLAAMGDLHVDQHHSVEDVGICLGQAFAQALGDKRGIRRYGFFTLPMDEALATVAVDFGGRPYLVFRADFPTQKIGDFDSQLVEEFWQAFTTNAACNLHINVHYGRNSHHISEAVFKSGCQGSADGRRMLDPRVSDVPSTKGTLS